MKVGLSEQTARKTLALIPSGTKDQDLQQLRTRLEQQLKATVNGGHLNQAELDALITAARWVLKMSGPETIRLNDPLNLAIPKLEALLARSKEAGNGGGR